MYLKTVLWLAFALFTIAALVDAVNGFLMGIMALVCLIGLLFLSRRGRGKVIS